jgi:hypothetical protein
VSGAWRNLSVNSTLNHTETFSGPNTSIVSGLAPGFSASLSGVRFGPLPVFGSVNGEAGQNVYINRFGPGIPDQDLSLLKVDLAPSVRAPLSTLPYLQVNATAAYRRTYFSESLGERGRQIEEPVTRSYTDLRVDVIGPVFSRVFNPNNAVADRLKHVIEPSFSIGRRSEIPTQKRIPSATGFDIIVGGVTQVNYGLTNRLMVRKEKGGEPTANAPRELLSVSVRQSYYTDETGRRTRSHRSA